jgi:hypothetical protein
MLQARRRAEAGERPLETRGMDYNRRAGAQTVGDARSCRIDCKASMSTGFTR